MWPPTLFFFFKIVLVLLFPFSHIHLFFFLREREHERERERERILNRLHVQCGAWCGARSHSYEIMTRAKIKSRMLNQLSHPGAPIHLHFTLFYIIICLYIKKIFNVYFWDTHTHSTSREGQKKRETQNPKQAPSSELSAQNPMQVLNSQTARSWPELKSDT